MIRRFAALSLVVAVMTAVGCARDPNAPDAAPALPAVVVGSGDSVVSDLIARFYAGALARMGTAVSTRFDLGERRQYLAQLGSGRITLVPEFGAELLTYYNPDARERAPKPVADELSRSLPEGLSVSDFSDTTDWRSAIALPHASAATLNARTLGELAPHCRDLTLGVPTGSLPPAVPATDQSCAFAAVKQYPADRLANALTAGEIQAALLPPTRTTGFAVVADSEYAIAAENPLPLFRTGALSDAQIKKLNIVAGELDTGELATMVADISAHRATPDAEASGWLDKHGF
jgi:osmoprotectant transport system substrate-binding protein